jgi:serine protease Do
MKRTIVSHRTVLALCAAGTLAGLSAAFMAKPAAAVANVSDAPVDRSNARAGVSYSSVVKKVAPSVVKVTTTAKMKNVGFEGMPGMDNDLLQRFFGQQFQRPSRGRQMPVPRQEGLGSGVIVSKDGYILTNNHVVDGADSVKVALQDGRDFEAKVIGRDPKTDVAVIKIDAKDLPTLELANSENIEVGDVVLAIGNPFGIGQTVTMGIVSAVGRGNMGLDYEDFIQTDAPINPGNSGGALVDTAGRLVGINTAILSRSGGNQGIGFAVPANLAHTVMTSLVADGKVTRGYLGAMIQDLTPPLAKQFQLKDNSGALVGEVKSGSPAEKSGLKAGDVVTDFNGKKVTDSRHLRLRVAETRPGTSVAMKVLRDGATKNLSVTVRELPGEPKIVNASASGAPDAGVLNGVGVGDLDSQTRAQIQAPASLKGVVVTEAAADSPAAEAGLKAGDVILEINRQPVKTADEAVKLTESSTDKTTLLRVWSNGGSRYLVVDESKAG